MSAKAIGTYIVSMSKDVSDVLAVLVLAKEAGLYQPAMGSRETVARLRVAPLFETIDDLRRAPDVLERLFANRAYAPVLKAQGSLQEVMHRLLRQQQGRRHPHVVLGAPQGTASALGRRPKPRHRAHALSRPWRYRRSRGRSEPRGHPRAAAGNGRRQDQNHRAGRGGLVQIRPSRDRSPEPGGGGFGGHRSELAGRWSRTTISRAGMR